MESNQAVAEKRTEPAADDALDDDQAHAGRRPAKPRAPGGGGP